MHDKMPQERLFIFPRVHKAVFAVSALLIVGSLFATQVSQLSPITQSRMSTTNGFLPFFLASSLY